VTALQAVFTVPLFVWLYGWQRVDFVEWRTLTAAPFALSLPASQQFLYGSPFSHLLGAYYEHQGLGFGESFLVVHGLALILLAVTTVRVLIARFGSDYWSAGALVLAASPLLLTVISWIGKDDTFLLSFYLLMLLSPSRLTRALLCALMIVCHRELAVTMLISHALLRASREGERGEAAVIGVGAMAGLAASYLYTNVLLDAAPLTRFDYMVAHVRGVLAGVIASPLAHFAAALGPFWLLVLRPSHLTLRRSAVLVLAAVMASMTLDFTRVFVMASAPLLLDLTDQVVAELRAHGGVAIFGRRWPIGALGLLAFTQVQIAGDRLSWIRGFAWVIHR
jgi:hypothetical protein